MTESSGLPAIEVYRLPTGRDLHLDSCDNEIFLTSAAQYLQECFDDLLCEDELLSSYIHQMQTLGLEAVVFGGWARDRLAELSKYPPAKPGALYCEPLKAVNGVANAAPI